MIVLQLCVLVCLPAACLATEFNAEAALKEYALEHPNTDGEETECTGILNKEEPEIGPLNAIVNRRLLWSGRTLYYSFGQRYPAEYVRRVRAAVADIAYRTRCVNIRESNTAGNRVVIRPCGGCSSYVGMSGGQQQMCLSRGCFSHGTIIHEFLHALGFHHEQKRPDRDSYIYINFRNIRRGMEYNFRKMREGVEVDLLGTRYDYNSVMHYGAYAFAVDRRVPTIIPKVQGARIGQRAGMSAIDIERVQILYGCRRAADSVYFKHLAHLY